MYLWNFKIRCKYIQPLIKSLLAITVVQIRNITSLGLSALELKMFRRALKIGGRTWVVYQEEPQAKGVGPC
jgi:hypothetical protein